MKNKFVRLISSLLIVAFLVSCMSVLAFADTADTGNTETETEQFNPSKVKEILVNRTFDEGWAYNNGFVSPAVISKLMVDYEYTDNFDYNYFCRVESTGDIGEYIRVDFGDTFAKFNGTVLELDIKTDDVCNFGNNILYFTSSDAKNNVYKLLGIQNNSLLVLTDGDLTTGVNPSVNAGSLADSWIHVAFCTTVNQRYCENCGTLNIVDATQTDNTEVFCCGKAICNNCNTIHDAKKEELATKEFFCCEAPDVVGKGVQLGSMTKAVTVRTYFSAKENFDFSKAIPLGEETKIDLQNTYYTDATAYGIMSINDYYIGNPSGASTQGQSYCFDNFKVYNVDFNADGLVAPGEVTEYGSNVDENLAKTEQIIGSGSGMTATQYIDSGIVMKLGMNYCLDRGDKRAILSDKKGAAYGAPVAIDGTVYLPLQAILDWMGYPMYQHDDGISLDLSTASGSTFITIGRKTATVNGQLVELHETPKIVSTGTSETPYVVVSRNDVEKLFEGVFVTYDDMGLIVVSEGKDIFNRKSDLSLMLDIMKSFIFDTTVAKKYYDNVKTTTNNFQHPYLLVNQDYFTKLNNAYKLTADAEGFDAVLNAYLLEILADAEEVFKKYTTVQVEEPEEGEEEEVKPASETDSDTAASDTATDTDTTGDGTTTGGDDTTVGDDTNEGDDTVTEPEQPAPYGEYHYLIKELVNIYVGQGNNGYNPYTAGNEFLVETTEDLRLLALAYNILGAEGQKYADLAHDIATALAKWDHWVPAYFNDCSEATKNYAIAYDWLYNAWTESGYKISDIEAAMYQKGLLMGYNFSLGEPLNAALSSNQGVYAIYNTATDSWNAIGTSGMVITALALIGTDYLYNGNVYGETSEDKVNTTEADYVKAAAWILENNINTLINNGLDMYAPDGSYIESASVWSQATEAFVLMVWALNNASGYDYGLMNTWGMDRTFYYAFQIEYQTKDFETGLPKYEYWYYHEATEGYLATDIAFYAADALNDDMIGALRAKQIGLKNVSLWDVLAYNAKYFTYSEEDTAPSLSLDYKLDALEGVVSRSGFGEDDIYVGIMGNANNATGGQVDSGNFIYANKGFTWFGDLGGETAGVYGYNLEAHRYGYYKLTGEGNNVVVLTTPSLSSTMPYGQKLEAGGTIIDYVNNEYGMYTIIDNKLVYNGKATQAKRGVLFTNDRSTVVLQDEILFDGTQACSWIVQTGADAIELKDNGTTAYLSKIINGKAVVLRAKILEPGSALRFSIMDTASAILSNTHKKNHSTSLGYNAETDRTGLKRLVIQQKEMNSFQCAVVLEIVENSNTKEEVQYEYTSINNWNPTMLAEKYVATEVDENAFGDVSLNNIVVYCEEAAGYVSRGYAYGVRMGEFFRAMARAFDSIYVFEPTGQIDNFTNVKRAYQFQYLVYEEQYNYLRTDINAYVAESKIIAVNVCGYNG